MLSVIVRKLSNIIKIILYLVLSTCITVKAFANNSSTLENLKVTQVSQADIDNNIKHCKQQFYENFSMMFDIADNNASYLKGTYSYTITLKTLDISDYKPNVFECRYSNNNKLLEWHTFSNTKKDGLKNKNIEVFELPNSYMYKYTTDLQKKLNL